MSFVWMWPAQNKEDTVREAISHKSLHFEPKD